MKWINAFLHRFRPHKPEKGQSLIILAFSFVGFVAMLGLAIDLGLVYAERTELKRALDAAALSGVSELPVEEAAMLRAIEYLTINGYPAETTDIYVRGCARDIYDLYTDSGAPCPGGCGTGNNNQLLFINDAPYLYQQATRETRNSFYINTARFNEDGTCSPSSPGQANRILVTGTVEVDMNFMRLIGFGEVPVVDAATAQNIDRLDVVLVIDRSGSMEFDPVCHLCWERTASPDSSESPRYNSYTTYPTNGNLYPYGYSNPDGSGSYNELTSILDHPRIAQACERPGDAGWDATDSVYTVASKNYMILEAELFSVASPQPDPELAQAGKGFWAMQRGYGNYDTNPLPSSGTSIDGRGAHMAYYPARAFTAPVDNNGNGICDDPNDPNVCTPHGIHNTIADAQTGNAPVMQYNFRFHSGAGWLNGGTAQVWARVHPSRGLDADRGDWRYLIDRGDNTGQLYNAYFAITSAECSGGGNTCDPQLLPIGHTAGDIQQVPRASIPLNDGSDPEDQQNNPPDFFNQSNPYPRPRALQPDDDGFWRWVLLDGNLRIDTDEVYRLFFYAGSTGYGIDRIMITDNIINEATYNDTGDSLFSDALNDATVTVDGTTYPLWKAPPTADSAFGVACDQCNGIYGKNISDTSTQCRYLSPPVAQIDNRFNAHFTDWESPMRPTKEAVKNFIRNLNPERDQVGIVAYNSNDNTPLDTMVQLQCDQRWPSACTPEDGVSNPYSYTLALKGVEDLSATGGTDTAEGMRVGLHMLNIDVNDGVGANANNECKANPAGDEISACARSNARKVLVVLTDGNPNANPGGRCDDEDLWEGAISGSGSRDDYSCPLWYAREAAARGVNVYAIGIGFGVDQDFIIRIGEMGRGRGYPASVNQTQLDLIFADILENITIKLIE